MQTFLWSFMTYGVLQFGVIIGCLLLSGWAPLESVGHKVCAWKFALGNGHKGVTMRLPGLLLFISGLLLGGEHYALVRTQARRTEMQSVNNLSGLQELKASVTRHQRNWWLCISALLIWTIVWRFSGVVKRLRTEIRTLAA